MSVSKQYILENIDVLKTARTIKKLTKRLITFGEKHIEADDKIKKWRREYRKTKDPERKAYARKRIKFWTKFKKHQEEKIKKVKKDVREAS